MTVPVQELKPIHKDVVSLHLQGMSNKEVAAICGITPEYVSALLSQDMIREELERTNKRFENKLQSLFPTAVDTIQAGMQNGPMETRLKAAKLQLEASGRLDDRRRGVQTAEDVVGTLLKEIRGMQVNVQVNVNNSAGEPGFHTIQQAADEENRG